MYGTWGAMFIHDILIRRLGDRVSCASVLTFRRLSANSSQGVQLDELMFDDGDIVDWIIRNANSAFARIPGVRREKMIGRLAGDVSRSPDLIKPLRNRLGRVAE